MDTTSTMDTPTSPTATPSKSEPVEPARNRHARRAAIARWLTRYERKLLQLARGKAKGAKARASENAAALELADFREAAAMKAALEAAEAKVRRENAWRLVQHPVTAEAELGR